MIRKAIDWEQRRYEIAKEVLPFAISEFASGDDNRISRGVGLAFTIADRLIKKLKEDK